MKHKTFLAVAVFIFTVLTAGAYGSSYSDSQTFTFIEYPWVNSNIIGRVPESYMPSPQEDFYVWKNHDWLVSTNLNPGRNRSDAFDELDDSIREKLTALMTDPTLSGHDAELLQNLYSSWLNWESRNAEGVKVAQRAFNIVKSLNSINDLTAYLASRDLNAKSLSSMFVYSIAPDMNDSEYYCLYLKPTYLRLEDSAEYKNITENGKRMKKAADARALYMLKRFGCSEEEIQKIITLAYDFEKSIADYIMTKEEEYLPENIAIQNNPITYDKLRSMSPAFPLADILISVDLSSDRVNLEQPKWLEGMNALYTEANLENMKAYLILCTVVDLYMSWSDEASFREYQNIENERKGITQSAPDTEEAFNFISRRLPNPLARVFVSKYVSPKTKQDVTKMIQEIVAEYRIMLRDEKWLSEQTRMKAIEKLDALKICAAYPDRYSDSEKISSLNIEKGENLLSAIDKLDKFDYEYYLSLLNTKIDRDLWFDEDISVVNAYYQPLYNAIVIPAGILGGDFYNPEASREFNLAGIGATIGHEVSHAFDPTGAQFDKDGNFVKWWTDKDFAAFNQRTAKLIDHISGMTILEDGTKWRGSYTQSETVADIIGLKVILKIAAKMEGFNYKDFFASHALGWKLVATPEKVSELVQTDVHPQMYLRCNAVVQLFPEFHETYGTQSGDRMYLSPERIKELEVW